MYLFQLLRSFLPMRNPIGFGASDFLMLAIAILLVTLLLAWHFIAPYARSIAPRTLLCMALLFTLTILPRLVLLPQSPVPMPTGADDFGYVLLGDTLRHFRLANTSHPLHQFFEAVFVLQQPSYASIYPLGQGLVLALGELLLRNFWFGVLLSGGIFSAFCYWMLRGWVAPVWALAGGLLAAMQFGALNPWMNSYWGGYVSAIAGCLVFGALPRMLAAPRLRYGLLLGTGLGLQMLTRPFESIFLAVAAAAFVGLAFRRRLGRFWKLALAAGCVVAATSGLILLQNKAVTHSWTTMPYMLSRYQYGVPATLTFQSNAIPHRQLTAEQELDYRAQAAIHGTADSAAEYANRLEYRFRYWRFFLLPPLYFALLAFLPNLRQRRYIWAAATALLFAVGTNFYPYFYPQYVAAVACLLVLFSVIGLQRLNAKARTYVALLCAISFVFWFGIYASGDADLLRLADFQIWNYINRGDPQRRLTVQDKLTQSAGQQLVFVRYSRFHRFEEWIHNDADIDSAQTVWANDLGNEENRKLLSYYPRRTAWLFEPDARPPLLIAYPSGPAPVANPPTATPAPSKDSGPFLTVH